VAIINRVAQSEIMVYDLAKHWDGGEIAELDIAAFLVDGIVLRESVFRTRVREHDWTVFADKHVAVHCSTDAIVPTWSYLLVAAHLNSARSVAFGNASALVRDHFARALVQEDWAPYRDRIVVVKGCGSTIVPVSAYVHAMVALMGVARKLMYGEPCSSVPLWRKSKSTAATARDTVPACPPSAQV